MSEQTIIGSIPPPPTKSGRTVSKSLTVSWNIKRKPIAIPTLETASFSYTGGVIEPTLTYTPETVIVSGTTQATNAGDYTITVTPTKNYCWPDGTFGAKELAWSITAITISAVPSQSGTLTYNGSSLSPQWQNYNSSQLTLGGTTTGNNAGTYTATFTPKAGYIWADGTSTAKNVSWTIDRAVIAATPSQSGSLTYTGSAQSPTWANYDSSKMTLGGTTSGTNAASYNAAFTPTANFKWSDGSTTAKTVSWSIGQLAGTLSISPTALEFSAVGAANAKNIAATSNLPGNATASSSATNIATVSVSGKNVSVTPVADGTATITVGMAANSNYTSPGSKTCSVKVSSIYMGPSKDATAAQFQSIIAAGQGPNRFAVGDLITVPVNGLIAGVTFAGNYFAQILGFNHNQPLEGEGNYVDVQFAVSSNNIRTLWVDSYYNTSGVSSSVEAFRLYHTSSNYYHTGYLGSDMAQSICPKFYESISAEWQEVIIDAQKPAVTGSQTDPGTMMQLTQVTVDPYKVWLPDINELLYVTVGTLYMRFQRYELYVNGNNPKRVNISNNTPKLLLTRTMTARNAGLMYAVVQNEDGTDYTRVDPNMSFGFSPCMRIG